MQGVCWRVVPMPLPVTMSIVIQSMVTKYELNTPV
jgi:hypothetical protein